MTLSKKLQEIVVKCLDKAPLSLADIEAANKISCADLMDCYGDRATEAVLAHVRSEFHRLRFQTLGMPKAQRTLTDLFSF